MAPDSTRRSLLAGAAASVATTGCLGRVRNIAGRNEPSPVTLEIGTMPADGDPHAIRIARHLAANLERAGIQPRMNTMSETELYRQVLINQEFDLFVGQFPEPSPFGPDRLYPFCHSEYSLEPGWQNPFGLTDLTIDELLDEQRHAEGAERQAIVDDLQTEIARQQPFVTVAFPDQLTAVRDTNFSGWQATQPGDAIGIVALDRQVVDGPSDGGDETGVVLRLLTTDAGITMNWNPIAVEYRRNGTYTGLLYDPLVREFDGDPFPCLARDLEWTDDAVRLPLRDVSWHDDAPVTTDDVAFTYAFLADTSLGAAESPIPTSRFRGAVSIVEDVAVVGDGEVEIRFGDVTRSVARRALRVPILPKHVWAERTKTAAIAGVEVNQQTTEALVTSNPDPVGTGPLRFVEASAESNVVFERTEGHPIAAGAEGIPEPLRGKPAFDRLEVEVVPSDVAAIQQVGDGYADATASNLGPNAVPRVGREADVRLVSEQSAAFYHVGFNARNEPLSNPRFRRAVARLVDKEWLAAETFDGYARPAASPLAASPEWVADDLRWDGGDPVVPFLGEEGEADVEAARKAFREIGYRYGDDGKLLGDNQ